MTDIADERLAIVKHMILDFWHDMHLNPELGF